MAEASAGLDLAAAVTLLGAAVVAVPLFRRAGLARAGLPRRGPRHGAFGLAVVGRPEAMLHVAELGVVLFLFIIGLEMEPRACGRSGARSSGSARAGARRHGPACARWAWRWAIRRASLISGAGFV
jgi:Kef-type K+ transport system membrane component KefB